MAQDTMRSLADTINSLTYEQINVAYNMLKIRLDYLGQEKILELRVGSVVNWNGKRGHMTGKITKINRTRVNVLADDSRSWAVPISMLNLEVPNEA